MVDPAVEDLTLETDAEEEIEEILPYPDGAPLDEQRRAFLVENYADPEIDIAILAPALAVLETYLKDGTVPESGMRKTKLKAVEKP